MGIEGWLTTAQAAELLQVSRDHVSWIRDQGRLDAVKVGNRWRYDPASVERLVAARASEVRWVSMMEAARLAGCSASLVNLAVRRGDLVQRRTGRGPASVERTSVLAWAARRRLEQVVTRDRREVERRRRELGGRPDLDHAWLTVTQAGAVLGVSRVWVARLAATGTIPFVDVDGRRWFRRDHLELWISARRAQASRRVSACPVGQTKG